jgi:hypothetical protein
MPRIKRLSEEVLNAIYRKNHITPEERKVIEDYVNGTICRNNIETKMKEHTDKIRKMPRDFLLMILTQIISNELTNIGIKHSDDCLNARKAGM